MYVFLGTEPNTKTLNTNLVVRDMEFEQIERKAENQREISQRESEMETLGSQRGDEEEIEELALKLDDESDQGPDHQENSGEIVEAVASSQKPGLQPDHRNVEHLEIVEEYEVETLSTLGKIEERRKSNVNVEEENSGDDDVHQDGGGEETPNDHSENQVQEEPVNLKVEKKKKKSKTKKTDKSEVQSEPVAKESENGRSLQMVEPGVSLPTRLDQKKLLEERIAKERREKLEARRQLQEVSIESTHFQGDCTKKARPFHSSQF